MAYVAVRGGAAAIDASLESLRAQRLAEGRSIDVEDILAGMKPLVGQVMSEASLYAPELAALAIKQAEGSPEEAVFILRAFRSTLPRLGETPTLYTESLRVTRRISAAFKDIPGGQILGASTDYSHRLLNFDLLEENAQSIAAWIREYEAKAPSPRPVERLPKVVEYLRSQGLMAEIAPSGEEPKDVTMKSLSFPTVRSERLQVLSRGQTGAVTALGYASLRGYGGGALHPTVGELRVGMLPLEIAGPNSDDDEDCYYLGEIELTEVESLIPVSFPRGQGHEDIHFELGYGICYGQNETKAVAMSLLDHCLETKDLRFPTHDEEFVLLHIDSVEATGFISHLKLPHYVTFQSKLEAVRKVIEQSKKEAKANGEVSASESAHHKEEVDQ